MYISAKYKVSVINALTEMAVHMTPMMMMTMTPMMMT